MTLTVGGCDQTALTLSGQAPSVTRMASMPSTRICSSVPRCATVTVVPSAVVARDLGGDGGLAVDDPGHGPDPNAGAAVMDQ